MLAQTCSKLLLARLGLQHAPASLLQLQQQLGATTTTVATTPSSPLSLSLCQPQQHRGKVTDASTAASASQAAQQASSTSSGWSWFGSTAASQSAQYQQQQQQSPAAATAVLPDEALQQPAASDFATSAAADASDPAAAAAAAVDAAAAAAAVSTSVPADLLGHADAILDVSGAAADAMVAAAHASVWLPTRLFMDLMLLSHDGMGLPWFEAIVAANVLVKAAAFPLAVWQQKLTPVMAEMRAETQKLQALSTAAAKAATAGEYAAHTEALHKAYADFNIKFKGKKRLTLMVPAFGLLQALVFISQFSAISTLASHKVPSMTYEGALWFSNLTTPDPIMLLPIICAATTLAQVHTKRFQDQAMAAGPTGQAMKPIMTAMSVVILVVGYFQPSAIALMWTANSVLTLGQNVLMTQPAFRRLCGLQPLASAAAAGGSSQKSLMDQWRDLTGSASPKSAAAVGAPPPGTPVAVNYVSTKPSRRRVKL